MAEPFAIHSLQATVSGQLALCHQPGRTGNLGADMAQIRAWQPDAVVTLTEKSEFPETEDPPLDLQFRAEDYRWIHLPVRDFAGPMASAASLWREALKDLSEILARDGRVLAHCNGGRGRSGMVLLRLLVAQGEDPATALGRLREIRPGAVETGEQFVWAVGSL